MKEADKEIKIIFTDLDGCPGIVMPRKNFDYIVGEFFMKKNASDYIKFDDFVRYIRQIPNFKGVVRCQEFMTWWSNNSTYRYYWPKCRASIFIDKGRYMDNARISGLTEVKSIDKEWRTTDNRTNDTNTIEAILARRSLMNSTYGIQSSNFILPKKIIHNNPATIVFWSDGSKTVAKCRKGDIYDPEVGFYVACAKKLFGNDYRAGGIIKTALEKSLKKGTKKKWVIGLTL